MKVRDIIQAVSDLPLDAEIRFSTDCPRWGHVYLKEVEDFREVFAGREVTESDSSFSIWVEVGGAQVHYSVSKPRESKPRTVTL